MNVMEHVAGVRQAYVDGLRALIDAKRAESSLVGVEVDVEAREGAGGVPEVLRFDLVVGSSEKPQAVVFRNDPPEGALIGVLRAGALEVAVFPFAWETCLIWFRHPEPDTADFKPWRAKWFDRAEKTPDGHELSGIVHYVSPLVREGRGHLMEIDFGSAPVEAFTDFLETLGTMGATDVRVGMSDGSELDPDVRKALQKGDLGQEELTGLVAQVLGASPDVARVQIAAEDTLEVYREGDNEPCVLYTGNLWRRLQRVPHEMRVKEVWHFTRMLPALDEKDQEKPDLEQLRPVVKDAHFRQQVLARADDKHAWPMRPLVADLWIMLVWDQASSMRFCTMEDLAEYELSEEEAFARARENLERMPREIQREQQDGVTWLRTGDNYDASLLLIEDLWRSMAMDMQGDILVCVPSREHVLVTGSGIAGGEAALRKMALRVLGSGDHLISGTILRWTRSGWHVHGSVEEPSAAPAPAQPSSAPEPGKKPWWKFW